MKSSARRFLPALLAVAIAVPALGAPAPAALKVGDKAPQFRLPGVDGKTVALRDSADKKATVVIFTCNHCPVAKAYEERIVKLAKAYQAKDVAFVAINPNDEKAYPDDSLEKMKVRAKERGFTFPYLRDADSSVARSYGAKVTPHFYVVDPKGVVQYVGRLDDSRDPSKVQRKDLQEALDDILAGDAVEVAETKAFGCSIKWVE